MNRLRSNPLPVVQLREALNGGLAALPDAELLDRFARYADHAAFEARLRRHGSMVFGVCRRTLASSADADDAFQATFLVFLRKAKTVRGERLGPWLYGVAWRVSQKARVRAARLAAHRTEGVEMLPAIDEHAPIPDWLPVLDAELNALPAKYRAALVLCELQGRSRAEAARELGLREGTLSSRLARGRDLLRKRLLKHGTLLPAGGLAALFTASEVGRATVPAALLATVSELAKTGAVAGAVPVGAARLTDEVLKSMFLTKLRLTGAALVALALTTVGLAAAAWPEEAPGGEPEQARAARAAEKGVSGQPPVDKQKPGPKLADREALQGLWVLDKYELGKGTPLDGTRQAKELIGKMRFLVAGDIWWGLHDGPGGNVFSNVVKLDATKTPKWADILPLPPNGADISKCTYELDDDRLRLYMIASDKALRPAEFNAEDDVPLVVFEFRRDRLPPAAGAKELIGSWRVPPQAAAGGADPKKAKRSPPDRVEVLDNFIFVWCHPASTPTGCWLGGRYTVDATKNPKWIDVDLVAPFESDKTTKLYGSYEVADGRFKLALGKQRATRPLEFKDADDVLLFDLGPAKAGDLMPEPVEAPMPRAK